MNEKYSPTEHEQNLIRTFWLLYPRIELRDPPNIRRSIQSVGAIGHELYMSLTENGYKITFDSTHVENRNMKPNNPSFFSEVYSAGRLFAQLPKRQDSTCQEDSKN